MAFICGSRINVDAQLSVIVEDRGGDRSSRRGDPMTGRGIGQTDNEAFIGLDTAVASDIERDRFNDLSRCKRHHSTENLACEVIAVSRRGLLTHCGPAHERPAVDLAAAGNEIGEGCGGAGSLPLTRRAGSNGKI